MGTLPMNDCNSMTSTFVATGVADPEGWIPGYTQTKVFCRRKCRDNQVMYLREEPDPNVSDYGVVFEGSSLERVHQLADKKTRNQKSKKLDTVDWKVPHEISHDIIPKDAVIYEMKDMVFGVPSGIKIPMETHINHVKDDQGNVIGTSEYKKANITDEVANRFLDQFKKSYNAIVVYPWDKLPSYYDPVVNKQKGFNAWLIVQKSVTKSKSEHAKKISAEYYIDEVHDNRPFTTIGKHFENLMLKMRKTDFPKSAKPFQIYRVWIHEQTTEGADKYWSYPLEMIYPYEFRMTIQPLNTGGGKRKRETSPDEAAPAQKKEKIETEGTAKEGDDEEENENDFQAADAP